jgi:hypothetical protein
MPLVAPGQTGVNTEAHQDKHSITTKLPRQHDVSSSHQREDLLMPGRQAVLAAVSGGHHHGVSTTCADLVQTPLCSVGYCTSHARSD